MDLFSGISGRITQNTLHNSSTNVLDSDRNGLTFDDIYPVGSIYMSVNSTPPSTLFGGSWSPIQGRFLLGCGDNGASGGEKLDKPAGDTGGEKDHLLSAAESGIGLHSHGPSSGTYFATGSGHFSKASSRAQTTSTGGITNIVRTTDSGTISSPSKTTEQSAGAMVAHNNLPPYLAVYMWQRTS